MRNTLFLALLGLLLSAGASLPLVTSAFACGERPCGERLPNVPSIPFVTTPPLAPAPPPVAGRRQAPPPVFTARVHECVVREVTLTARTRELLAEREAQARQRAECLPAGTREAYVLQVQRNAELAEEVSELQAEIIRLQDRLLAVLPPQPERQEPLAPPQGP